MAEALTGMFIFDQLDFVAVRIFDEGDDRGTAFHRAGFAGDLAACAADAVAGGGNVVHAQL